MGKINKALRAIGQIIKRPYLLNLILDAEEVWKDDVVKRHHLPQGLPCVSLHEFLPSEGMEVAPYAFLDGGSLPTDIALLRALSLRNKVEDYLEIGTWRGESVANVAATGAQCITINLPDEEMRKMGLAEDYINIHRIFSQDKPNIRHIQAHSHEFDFGSLNKKFDLIFIDGDHHRDSILKDTKTAFGLLKNERSIIVWHDYALSPETPRFEVLSGILDGCPEACRPHLYHVSNSLCALFSREPLKASPLKPNEKPEISFIVNVKGVRI